MGEQHTTQQGFAVAEEATVTNGYSLHFDDDGVRWRKDHVGEVRAMHREQHIKGSETPQLFLKGCGWSGSEHDGRALGVLAHEVEDSALVHKLTRAPTSISSPERDA